MGPSALVTAPFQTVSVLDPDEPPRRADLTSAALAWIVGCLLALVFVVALRNPPATAVQALLGVYLFAAGAWVFAQARSYRSGWMTVLRWWALVGLLVLIAGGAVVAWNSTGAVRQNTILVTVMLVYVGAGFGLTRLRARIQVRKASGLLSWVWIAAVVLALIALVVAGVLLLDDARTWALALIAAGLVPLPASGSLLADHLSLYLRSRRTTTLVVGAVGLVVLAGAAWVGAHGAHNALPAYLALAFLVLVVAIVSATLLDIAIVLVVVALLGVTNPQQELMTPQTGSRTLVAIGDSYMSGEGAQTFIAGTDDAGKDECRRANTAWTFIDGAVSPFDSVDSLACSGATSLNLRLTQAPPGSSGWTALTPTPQEQYPHLGTQLESYLADHAGVHPSLVVLSIGGNDIGFSSLATACLVPGSCAVPSGQDFARLRNRLDQVYADVARVFPHTAVAVIPYPDVAQEVPAGQRCSGAFLTSGDVATIRSVIGALDTQIQQAAAAYGFYYVADMRTALAAHHLQLCDPRNGGRAGVNFVAVRSLSGLSQQKFNPLNWKHNSLHPNERGHAALAVAFEHWIGQQGRIGTNGLVVPMARPAQLPAAADETTTPGDCQLVDTQGPCHTAFVHQAFGLVGDFLRSYLLALLMGLVGAWCLAVALLAPFGPRSNVTKDSQN